MLDYRRGSFGVHAKWKISTRLSACGIEDFDNDVGMVYFFSIALGTISICGMSKLRNKILHYYGRECCQITQEVVLVFRP